MPVILSAAKNPRISSLQLLLLLVSVVAVVLWLSSRRDLLLSLSLQLSLSLLFAVAFLACHPRRGSAFVVTVSSRHPRLQPWVSQSI